MEHSEQQGLRPTFIEVEEHHGQQGALGSFFWLDLAYGVVVAMGFPHLVINLLY